MRRLAFFLDSLGSAAQRGSAGSRTMHMPEPCPNSDVVLAMLALLRTLHVLSLAIWLGSVVFFTIAGLLIFGAFEEVSRLPREQRPLWFPLPEVYDRDSPGEGFPEPLRLEQGNRAAGQAVGKICPV